MFEKCVGSVKTMLAAANIVTLIGGIVIFFISWSIRSDYHDYEQFLTDNFFFLTTFCIVTSAIILVVCILGFAGLWTEHYYINIGFVIGLIAIFALHTTACITAYMLRGSALDSVHGRLADSLLKYNGADVSLTIKWDDLQAEFQCCGAYNVSDWSSDVPVSCCKHVYGTTNKFECNKTNAYERGCSEEFGDWARARATTLAVTETVLLVIEAIIVVMGIMLAKILRDDRGFI